ncbi:nucleotidyltransferase domain-containing protein [Candidatus Poribacteria bacterium]|nr:nucleotidyltransferase domain-containing protein [Candidatus Poribacteria bacterium]
MDIDIFKPQLIELFKAYDVVLAYLFGSHAKGTAGSGSDVDIAVLFADDVPQTEYGRRMVQINTELVGIFHINDVDVVVLNIAPPLLVFQVIKHGICVYDPGHQRVGFEVAVFNRYVDTQPLRDVQWKYYLKRQKARRSSQKKTRRTSSW